MSRTIRNKGNILKELSSNIEKIKWLQKYYEETKDRKVLFKYDGFHSYYDREELSVELIIKHEIEFNQRNLQKMKRDRIVTHQGFLKYRSKMIRKTAEKDILHRILKEANIDNFDVNFAKQETKSKKYRDYFL